MKFSEMPYSRVDFPAVIAQGKEIIQRASQAKSGEEQFELHQEFNKLMDHVKTLYTIAYIRRDGDVTDEFYDGEKSYYDEKLPELNAVTNEYTKVLFATPYRQYMEEKIGPVAFKSMELEMKSFNESLIPLMQEENALASRYSKLIASAKIMWEGEELNLSLMRKYMRSSDRDTRKKAWDAFSEFFEKNQPEIDEIYDLMVKNRTKQAQMLGFENYIDMGYCRMNRNSYTKEDIQKLRDQIKTVFVPLAAKMHKNRQARLGVEALRYYDMGVYFPQGDPAPTGTPEEILESGRKMYSEMSDETRDFFNMMMENELFDVFGRKNKATGGYMTELPDYGVPFIFANFNGTSGDVDVITHECGHAFQGYLSAKDPIREHADIGMETAEIHSMSMEFFTEPWYGLFFEGKTADDYKEMHLEDAALFIPYGCMVDEFQHRIYDNPELTPDERKAVWKELEQIYKPHQDYGALAFYAKGCYWQRQHHIYSYPFYYIDYVIAQLCAFEYKNKMDEDYKEAWQSYLKLCRLSASDYFENLLKAAGIRSPFEEGCMKEIVDKLKKKIN